MKKSKFTEAQIVKALKEVENGRSVNEVSRELGVKSLICVFCCILLIRGHRKNWGFLKIVKSRPCKNLGAVPQYQAT